MGDLAGHTLAGRYDVLASLGSGGMGAVYRARDRELDEEIALKVIRHDRARQPASLERFRREVKLARRVTHRNVARTFELVRAGDIMFCTMELVDGESLRHRLAREKRLPATEAVAIARELCDGLAAAHAAGVIHRDIKPDNVLIARDGRVVLADFGVAEAVLSDHGDVAGTAAYMAPEQARGEPPTPATDIYAVGLVLYEMVAGTRAFHGTTAEVVRAKQQLDHLDAADCGRELASVIARATARDLGQRIASATELGRLLGALAHATPTAPPVEDTAGYEVHTVIVLPPRTTASAEHLAMALHEDVVARLGRLPRVRALARTSATAEPADSVVELVVDGVMSATITRPAGAPMVLRLPLVVGELEAAAEAIASAVATAVEQVPARLSRESADALELLLSARAHLGRGFSDTAHVLSLLERANELAPGNPRITAALAFAEVRASFFYDDTSADRLARARQLVRAALATGPDRVESQLAAAHLELHMGKSTGAARHFRDAIARAPHTAEAHEYLGRMLLEAGFLELGFARLEDALAMAPNRAAARWDIARVWALEGRWDDYDRLVAELVAADADRWLMRLRGACWRNDKALLARVRAEHSVPPPGDLPQMTADIADSILDGSWAEHRGAIVAKMLAPAASWRRRAFSAQLVAEAAGWFGDVETCLVSIDRAVGAGMFDLHWLDHCSVLASVRGPALDAARTTVARRASAILDAMYGDAEPDDAETAID